VPHRIGVIPGDGIGHEVVPEALKVVRATGVDLDCVDYDLGGARYLSDGTVLDDATVAEWRGLDALLLGAVGTPEVPPGVIERGLLLKMRFDLDLYINQRPFVAPDGTHDFIVIRENTEGTYAGEGGFLRKDTARGGDPGFGQHPVRRGALRALRLRTGPVEGSQAPHVGAQDQCAHVRR